MNRRSNQLVPVGLLKFKRSPVSNQARRLERRLIGSTAAPPGYGFRSADEDQCCDRYFPSAKWSVLGDQLAFAHKQATVVGIAGGRAIAVTDLNEIAISTAQPE